MLALSLGDLILFAFKALHCLAETGQVFKERLDDLQLVQPHTVGGLQQARTLEFLVLKVSDCLVIMLIEEELFEGLKGSHDQASQAIHLQVLQLLHRGGLLLFDA
jgi:hypothetical protein